MELTVKDVTKHPWPDCREVQCRQSHDLLNQVMQWLWLECDDSVFVVGKCVLIYTEIKRLQSQQDITQPNKPILNYGKSLPAEPETCPTCQGETGNTLKP